MHPLIPISEIEKLTDIELLVLEARLKDIMFSRDLPEADLQSCLASLSNASFVRALRERPRSEIPAP